MTDENLSAFLDSFKDVGKFFPSRTADRMRKLGIGTIDDLTAFEEWLFSEESMFELKKPLRQVGEKVAATSAAELLTAMKLKRRLPNPPR